VANQAAPHGNGNCIPSADGAIHCSIESRFQRSLLGNIRSGALPQAVKSPRQRTSRYHPPRCATARQVDRRYTRGPPHSLCSKSSWPWASRHFA
jgi:hypothetical protein